MSIPEAPDLKSMIAEAVAHLKTRADLVPEVAIVLGSGLGPLADRIEDAVHVPYAEIPHFPESTVAGHSGELILGTLAGKKVVAQKGRFHVYEGYALHQVTFPVRVMHALGAPVLLLSNAAGGLNRQFETGDLMVIEDQINWMFVNPLMGPNDEELGKRFTDMSEPFSPRLRALAHEVALEQGIRLRQGVLASVAGPTYETPAELRMLARAGGDAVGMSVIPEVLVAVHAGIPEILGITCITDMATGEAAEPISHEQVLAAAKEAEAKFTGLVEGVLGRL